MEEKPKKLSLEDIVRRQEQSVQPPSANPGTKTSYIAVPVNKNQRKPK